MRIQAIITGAAGQLGSEFVRNLHRSDLPITVHALDHSQLDITNFQSVLSAAREFVRGESDIIINCAAYNKVDLAETDRDVAVSVNVLGPRNLAVVAHERGCRLVHFSTDYVFDGSKSSENGYSIADHTNPISWYGQTKLQGEHEIARHHGFFYIVRLSSVFGIPGSNFVTKIREIATTKRRLRVVNTQTSSIAYTADLVPALINMLRFHPYGIYHLANDGFCSRFQWAEQIVKSLHMEIPIDVNDDVSSGARRPTFSGLQCFPLPKLPHWSDATERYVRALDAK